VVRLHRRGCLTPSLVGRRGLLTLALVFAVGAGVRASDWPAFRGPTGQGHSDERDLPVEWSESRHVTWKVPVPGRGWSSPVVANGRIWLTTATRGPEASLRLIAFDASTGETVLDREVFSLRQARLLNSKNSFASPTPIVDGDRVYVHFGFAGTAALTLSGDVVWTARFGCQTQHGDGGSPVLHGDLLIFSCDGFDTAFIVALDTRTGMARWQKSRSPPWSQAYTTPIIIGVGGRDQVISVGAYRTVAYDPESGREIWRVGYADGFSNVPAPVFGQGLVFIATGFQQPSVIAVRADGTGDVTPTHVAWTRSRGAPLTPSPLVVGEELYLVSDTGVASCVEARTGRQLWQARLGGNYSASPVYADGRIYFQSEEGVTTVIAAGSEFRTLAVNRLDGQILASLAVSDGAIVIRTGTHLYRIDSAE
jgi:outer membrane protein assembly factor BamB